MGILQFCVRLLDAGGTLRSAGLSTDGPRRYSTMDNIDGKQARRTGQSSPLGELFEYVPGPQMGAAASDLTQPWH